MGEKSKRLLLTSVDDAAENEPDRRFAVIPKGLELSDGFMNMSMKELARAVNCMAWWIESVIGEGKPRETLAYMASNDVRYVIFLLACQKTGHQVPTIYLRKVSLEILTFYIGLLSFYEKLR
jgi:acyl-CoA synthetase (AMP-forming)/AMP-acid ligase II